MIKLQIKPLSINDAYKGRRFRTTQYDTYIRQMMFILPEKLNIPESNIKMFIEFGYSSYASDIDNGLKCFIDCLQKKYGFNDKNITELNVRKIKVFKGSEHIIFEIS
jgi:Holliday junction resolvase RusA-like endonuclease